MSDVETAKALFFAGLDCLDSRDYANAEQRFRDALKLVPKSTPVITNLSAALFAQEKHAQALEFAAQAIAADANNIEGLLIAANCLAKATRFAEAISNFDKVIALEPRFADAYSNRAAALLELKRYPEALADCDRAIAIDPNLADAYSNRGIALGNLKRGLEALASYDKAIALKPGLAAAWLGRGNTCSELNRHIDALAAYDRALALNPNLAEAWLGRGNAFANIEENDNALAAFDRALAIAPGLSGAWLGRGHIFTKRFQHDAAFEAFDRALALKSDAAEAWLGRGSIYLRLRRFSEAFAAYDTAFKINPELKTVEGLRLYTKRLLSDWTDLDKETAHLLLAVRQGNPASVPFALLGIASSPADQLQCARRYVSDSPSFANRLCADRYSHDRIRVAYLSPDLREHPVAYLTAGVFDHHDRSRFEITAISLGPDEDSQMRRRLKQSFDRFISVEAQNDQQAAETIRQLEIDIVVDLCGFTDGARSSILARRPAPIAINYLGYPATMGAGFIDYIIADRTVIPAAHQDYYAEKIVYMPDTFQANDRKCHTADKLYTRAQAGLLPDGFVFCCFNASYKITPDVFDLWMRILRRCPGSVLWIYANSPAAENNLRREAAARGTAADRLIFAPPMPLSGHQARLPLADLFLDTLPFNAGATASGALWAGTPILTRLGDSFTGRMGASLLSAIGLPELIADSSESYEALAVELATQPDKIAAIKRKLAANRLIMPLFDTERFTRNLEKAYVTMWERQQRGEAPRTFAVEPVSTGH